MKYITLIAALLFSSTLFASQVQLDTSKSQLEWEGSKVASSHIGTVPVESGNLTLNNGKIENGEVVVNIAKMTNKDLEGKWRKKLLNHLKSDDFFSTDKYKTAKLSIENVKQKSGNNYEVMGKLTIKDVTKPITFPATITKKGDMVKANGTLTFDRTEFGIKYNSGKFFESLGDKLINDEVKVKFNIQTKA